MNMDLRPDAQAFDEIQIRTVPRYKTSGLSGDEWRISASVEFYRKGEVVHEESCRDVESACKFLAFFHAQACDNGKGWFASVADKCDQEGCSNTTTVTYRKLKSYCREGHETEPHRPVFRQFCEDHKERGDCGLDDADRNYTDQDKV